MAKKKIHYEAHAGVGFDLTPSRDGRYPNDSTSVVLAIHPVHGTRVYGPFVTDTAARIWMERDGEEYIASTCGRLRDLSMHVVPVEVPVRYL
jgi:hypothetical protein